MNSAAGSSSGAPLLYRSDSEAQTERFAAIVARHLRPGSLIALSGDLGSGKTCFVRGLATGLGIPAEQGREYRHCASQYSIVTVDFKKVKGIWKVSRKSAYWF